MRVSLAQIAFGEGKLYALDTRGFLWALVDEEWEQVATPETVEAKQTLPQLGKAPPKTSTSVSTAPPKDAA